MLRSIEEITPHEAVKTRIKGATPGRSTARPRVTREAGCGPFGAAPPGYYRQAAGNRSAVTAGNSAARTVVRRSTGPRSHRPGHPTGSSLYVPSRAPTGKHSSLVVHSSKNARKSKLAGFGRGT